MCRNVIGKTLRGQRAKPFGMPAPALRGACPDSDRPRPELVVWQLQDDGQRVQSAEEVAAAAGAERQIVSERQQVEEERIVEQSGPQHATAGDLDVLPGDAAHFRRRAIAFQPHFLNPLAIGVRKRQPEGVVFYAIYVDLELIVALRVKGRGARDAGERAHGHAGPRRGAPRPGGS